MNLYNLTINYENTKTYTEINVQANGKEEAIDKALEIMFKKNFQMYMHIDKVTVNRETIGA